MVRRINKLPSRVLKIKIRFFKMDINFSYNRLLVDGREEQELDLTKPLSEIKKMVNIKANENTKNNINFRWLQMLEKVNDT